MTEFNIGNWILENFPPTAPRLKVYQAVHMIDTYKGATMAMPNVEIRTAGAPRVEEILSPGALSFLGELHRRFNATRLQLLAARAQRQKRFDAGETPDFLPETKSVRDGDWKVGPIPGDLQDRRVEITGPVDRKMIVNALNSGAKVFMADFEDASSPVFANMIDGQANLKDLWAGVIDFTDERTGKNYAVKQAPAALMVRPRGWHLNERHLMIDGEEVSGSLFDFGLYVFHCAKSQAASGSTPAFYLPKMESHQEARLWNQVFALAEDQLGFAIGTFKATVLIETLPAAFEMDEILYELRDHIVGLNCGRWDYIFSFIKRLAKNEKFLTPDRSLMTMGKAFLNAYSLLLIKTCHRRGAFAMGGMAAQIPIKGDSVANEAAFDKVRADKEREAGNGHDGTWVAHPDLVPVAMEVFNRLMPQANQLSELRADVRFAAVDLLHVHEGERTEGGLRENIRVGVQYIEAWLRGRGAVPLYNLMEDAATAEICRAQIWQWLHHKARLADGRIVTPDLFKSLLDDEMVKLGKNLGESAFGAGRFTQAIDLFTTMSLSETFDEFLTIPAYEFID
jgi:malate synthase